MPELRCERDAFAACLVTVKSMCRVFACQECVPDRVPQLQVYT